MPILRYAAVLATVPVLAVAINPTWVAASVLGIFEPQLRQDEIQKQIELGHHLDLIDSELRRQIHMKDAHVDELIAGRTTLAEVTNQFMVMNQAQPASMTQIRRNFPGATDEEKTARNVIGTVTIELSKRHPEQMEEILTRLEDEFEDMQRQSTALPPTENE